MGKNWFFVLYGILAIAVFARIIPPHTGAGAILDILLDMEIGAILLLLHQEGWWPRD